MRARDLYAVATRRKLPLARALFVGEPHASPENINDEQPTFWAMRLRAS